MNVTVVLHDETASWWAESPDVPGFSAAADSPSELVADVRDGLAYFLGLEPDDLHLEMWFASAASTMSRMRDLVVRGSTSPGPEPARHWATPASPRVPANSSTTAA